MHEGTPFGKIAHSDRLFTRCKELISAVAAFLERAEREGVSVCTDFSSLEQQLDEPFSVFVCGEFNSGKSVLINRIAREDIAKVGILPTTEVISPLQPKHLKGLVLVDSPGTNSIIEQHQAQTEHYLQRADLIVFITSCERPLTDSEARFLNKIKSTWSRKVIVVLNKIDLLESTQVQEVSTYLIEGIERVLSFTPPLYRVSALTGEGCDALRDDLLELLTDAEQVRLKLSGPPKTLAVYLAQGEPLLTDLREATEKKSAVYGKILRRAKQRTEEADLFFRVYEEKIFNLFSSLVQRLQQFVDDHFSLRTLLKERLFGRQKARQEKVRLVIGDYDLQTRIEAIVDEAADTLKTYQQRLLTEAAEDLKLAGYSSEPEIEPPLFARKEIKAEEISEELRKAADRGIDNFLTLSSVAAAAGIGVKVASAAAVVEISGLAAMLTLAVLGFRAVPVQKRKAKALIQDTFSSLGKSFLDNIRESFKQQLSASMEEFTKMLAPVIGEFDHKRERLVALQTERAELDKRLEQFQQEIAALS